MDIVINMGLDVPIYRQLYDGLRGQIMHGILKCGDSLPPIRSVASELGISVITVKKAWEELERDGLIVTAAGKGCFVAQMKGNELDDKKLKLLTQRIKTDLEYYKTFGISDAEILSLIEKQIRL